MPEPKEMGSGVDVTKSERKVWLLKVPGFAAQKLRTACQQSARTSTVGAELGRITLAYDAVQASAQYSLSLVGPHMRGIPAEYSMRVQNSDRSTVHVLAEGLEHKGIEGRVEHRFDVEMKQGADASTADPEYRELNRQRNLQASTKTRTMQVIDDPRSVHMRPAQVTAALANKRKEASRLAEKKAAADMKRHRIDKDALENFLFRLFERQPHWKFTQLHKETNQPVQWLKEILAGVAVLNKSGPHKDLWEVKKEYRT